jgi:uncharacterized OB-fold protein
MPPPTTQADRHPTAGITAYHAYLPDYRLPRGEIAAAIGASARGLRCVAGYDEDSTTLAVAAALPVVRGREAEVGSLWLATTDPVYADKTNATVVHAALDLRSAIVAADLGASLRSGVVALLLAARGGRCGACGAVQFPAPSICYQCRAAGEFEPVPAAGQTARIVTSTVDRLAFSLSPPLVSAIVAFEHGGRLNCELTDVRRPPGVGDEVVPTFRRGATVGGIRNYLWKARPVYPPQVPAGPERARTDRDS